MLKFFALVALISAQTVSACSCAKWASAQEMLNDYDAVFLAIPSADSVVVPNPQGQEDENELEVYQSQLSVVKSFKKIESKNVELYTSLNVGAGCGVEFKKDEAMVLIFAGLDDQGNLQSNSCSLDLVGSEDVAKMIRELNELKK